MNYWLIALPRERLEFCITNGIFGLNRKYILPKVQKSDKVLFYATKYQKIIAVGEVTEPYHLDDTPVFTDYKLFSRNDVYPDRIRFTARKLEPEIDFIQLIDKMSFIKSLANWQIHFRSAILQIAESDWKVIAAEFKAPTSPTE